MCERVATLCFFSVTSPLIFRFLAIFFFFFLKFSKFTICRYVDDLMSTHAQHLQRIKTVSGAESQGSETQKKKKKKKKKADAPSLDADEKGASLRPAHPSCDPTTLEIAIVKAKLARATFMVLAVLTKLGHLSTTPPHLASHGLNDLETLFAHRFKAFRYMASPRPLNFQTYISRIERDGCMVSK